MLIFLTSAYIFEKTICEKCQARRLDRVVHAIEHFTHQAEPTNPFSKVECLVFELASGDVRGYLNAANTFDVAFRLCVNIMWPLASISCMGLTSHIRI